MNLKCITGYDNYLYEELKQSFQKAKKIDIIVSFLMESGVKLLKKDLLELKKKNIPVRILTGNYLNITQPSALYLLKDIMENNVDLRFYNDTSRSFHPKAYIIEYEDGGDVFIGSSNISKSALTGGIEWNYRIDKNNQIDDYNNFKEVFENLFLNHSIIIDDKELESYSKQWKKPKIARNMKDICVQEEKVITLFEPRGAQIEALYELKKTRVEGNDKALIVAATGIGKTYLAAFDSKNFNKILFVAHREEILKQAYTTFQTIMPNKNSGFFMNSLKDNEVDILFASVQSLGKEIYLREEFFQKDYFDYIIIDEFHHAVSSNYQNIINYFEPKFMLGLTATPERLDNKDVFSICDYNVVYEVNLKSAIEKDWLVPFRYYGIYDDSINYEEIEFKNGKYNEKQLEEALSINKRATLVFNNYKKYKSKRALGFCSSKVHAEYMAKFFNENGIKSCSVYSGNEGRFNEERSTAIKKLLKEELQIIFSVDMFNEGLDIKNIDMVLFLRPTESPTIFLQQLGRGLRKDGNKRYLNVLDFIGNYKKANLIPFLLNGKNKQNTFGLSTIPKEEDFPEDCFIDFDFRIIDLFEKMNKETEKFEDVIIREYFKIKEDLRKVPSRLEMFIHMDPDIYINMKRKSSLNIFKDYLGFLNKIGELNKQQFEIINTSAHLFIKMIETTSMSKTYKVPVLLAFYNNGNLKTNINDDDLYNSFKEFYKKASNKVDMLRDKSTQNFMSWNKNEFVSLARRNPIKALIKNSGDFFNEKDNLLFLDNKIIKYIDNIQFSLEIKDSIEFRIKEFYKNRLEKREN